MKQTVTTTTKWFSFFLKLQQYQVSAFRLFCAVRVRNVPEHGGWQAVSAEPVEIAHGMQTLRTSTNWNTNDSLRSVRYSTNLDVTS